MIKVKYDIVDAPSLGLLMEMVNRRCDLDWEPHGSLVVAGINAASVRLGERTDSVVPHFIQPMVKKEVV